MKQVTHEPDSWPSGTTKILMERVRSEVMGEELVAWAVGALEVGFDGRNLRILAGLDIGPDHVFHPEAARCFERVLEELGIEVPDGESLPRLFLGVVSRRLLAGELLYDLALDEVHACVIEPLGHPEDLRDWCFLWERLDPETYSCLTEDQVKHEAMHLAESYA